MGELIKTFGHFKHPCKFCNGLVMRGPAHLVYDFSGRKKYYCSSKCLKNSNKKYKKYAPKYQK